MKEFWKAVTEKLRTDTVSSVGLVALTGDNTNDRRIIVAEPPFPAKKPLIGIFTRDTISAIPSSNSLVIITPVIFGCVASKELAVSDIASRVKHLLDQRGVEIHNQYLDVSDDVICNTMTDYRSMSNPIRDDSTDSWMVMVEADFRWHFR